MRDPVLVPLSYLQTFFRAGASVTLVVESSAPSADAVVSFVAQAASQVASTSKAIVFFKMVFPTFGHSNFGL